MTVEAAEWDRRYAGSELVWSAEPNRWVVAELSSLPPGRALDLACGEGRNAIWLAGRGWAVQGVDFSAAGLDKARALADRAGVTVDWLQADVTAWTPPAGAYDLVLLAYLHLPALPRRAVLRAAAAALAPAGTLLVIGHDRANLTEGVGGPQHPAILLDAAELRADLEGTGLRLAQAGRALRPVPTPEGERTAVDTVLRAVLPRIG